MNNLVPRSDLENDLGTPQKRWNKVNAKSVNTVYLEDPIEGECVSLAGLFHGVCHIAKRNADYTVGDIATFPSLPSWAYLRCTVSGTTDADTPIAGNTAEGDIIPDGTVIWLVCRTGSEATGIKITKDGHTVTINENGDTALGFCGKRRIERNGDTVSLYWQDPEPTTVGWAGTVIVKKHGSYPAKVTDGEVVAVSVEHNAHKEVALVDHQSNSADWFYRAFPVSSGGSVSYSDLNKFDFWHFGYWVDRDDAIESTCVHPIEGLENEKYHPLKMIYDSNVENNRLDWGDWKNAPFMPKPCMLRTNGTVDYYLNPDDYAQKEDGTPSDIANTAYDGNAMMEWSKVFVRVVNEPSRYFVYFASEKVSEDYECYSCLKEDGTYAEHFYLPIYEGRIVDSVMRSLSTGTDGSGGAKPTASTTLDSEMTAARANGTGWNITTWADENLLQALAVLITGRLNISIAIGYNCGSSTSALTHNCGSGNKKGLFFGHYTTSAYATKFFGMENWWGHRWRRCAGLITSEYEVLAKMTRSTADGSTVTNYNSTGEGYIRTGIKVPSMSGSYFVDVAADKYGIFIPVSLTKYKGDTGTVSGSSTTYYCDGGWSSSGLRALFLGGAVANGAVCGLFAFNVYFAPSSADWDVGASLSFHSL